MNMNIFLDGTKNMHLSSNIASHNELILRYVLTHMNLSWDVSIAHEKFLHISNKY